MIEVGGFCNTSIRSVSQDSTPDFPRYIPAIYSNTRRLIPLDRKMVAVPFWRIVGGSATSYDLLVKSETELRKKFLIATSTKFLTVGSGFDSKLENFWCNVHRNDLLSQLPSLGVTAVTTPNFSYFTDMMGSTKLYNFRRILLATQALSEAGVTPIPHLNALTNRDWDNWYSFLKDQPSIRAVAKEFTTGLASPEMGKAELRRLSKVQDKLGYPLHLIAIGGVQFGNELNSLFSTNWSVTDADPFFKTVKRQKPYTINGKHGWKTAPLPNSASLDERLLDNIQFAEDVFNEHVPIAPVFSVPSATDQLEFDLALAS
jgi:hypothetical protein